MVDETMKNRLNPNKFIPIGNQPVPSRKENPECVYCGKMPFIVNNTGIKVETSEGEILPNG